MFKLPVCPHCHTIYRYGDAKKNLNRKIHTCYHCKKSFKTSFSGLWLLLLITVAVGIVLNIIEISVFSRINVTALMITNIVLILFFLLFVPFFTKYRKTEQKLPANELPKNKKQNSRKNKRA